MELGGRVDPNSSDPKWKRWVPIGAVIALALLVAAAWFVWRMREAGAQDAQRARLVAALQREKDLTAELVRMSPSTAECPPGQVPQQPSGPSGVTGATPSTSAAPTPAPAGSTPAPAASTAAALPPIPAVGEATVLGGDALVQQLERATAIVIVAGANDLGTGTGFFIAPNLLLTNRHVVEQSGGKRLFVTSRELGSLRRATVLRVTRSSNPGEPDFALLRMDDGVSRGALDMAAETAKLAGVVAAGYPGVVLSGDANFRRLLGGDLSAAPDLNLTRGAVQSLQAGEGGMPLIVHTASIAKGNSGGPLVDGCGRVIGVNTFINVDQSQSSKINYAIHSRVLTSFLQAANANPRIDARPCKS
jgi:S1-C subfamily serine protease